LYPETLPSSKDTAVVRYLRESPGIGTYVTLCEYGNIEGLIPAGQSSFPDRRTRGKARKFPKTKDVVVKVIRSSPHGTDLSRRVDSEAQSEAKRRYQKARRLRSFFRELLIYDPTIDAKTAMRWMHNLHQVAAEHYDDEDEESAAEKAALDLVAEATRDENPGILAKAGIDGKTAQALFSLLRKRKVLPTSDAKDNRASAQVMIGCLRSGVTSVQLAMKETKKSLKQRHGIKGLSVKVTAPPVYSVEVKGCGAAATLKVVLAQLAASFLKAGVEFKVAPQ